MADWIPVVPARGGAVAASGLSYTVFFFSSIELARAVRQPGPCVRVNFSKLLRCCPRTWLRWNDPSRTRRTQEVPFIASCSHFIHGKTQGFVLRLRPQNKVQRNIHAAITMRFASTRGKTPKENRLRVETIQAAPAAHRRYLSSPAAATWHGKTQGFVLRLPPQNKAHAAIPIRFATTRTHPFITMRFASTRGRTPRENRYKVMMANW